MLRWWRRTKAPDSRVTTTESCSVADSRTEADTNASSSSGIHTLSIARVQESVQARIEIGCSFNKFLNKAVSSFATRPIRSATHSLPLDHSCAADSICSGRVRAMLFGREIVRECVALWPLPTARDIATISREIQCKRKQFQDFAFSWQPIFLSLPFPRRSIRLRCAG